MRDAAWEARIVAGLVAVADALAEGRNPSAGLAGLVKPWDAARIDRLARAYPAAVAGLAAGWSEWTTEEKQTHMRAVVARWKTKQEEASE